MNKTHHVTVNVLTTHTDDAMGLVTGMARLSSSLVDRPTNHGARQRIRRERYKEAQGIREQHCLDPDLSLDASRATGGTIFINIYETLHTRDDR